MENNQAKYGEVLLQGKDLTRQFGFGKNKITAVDKINFSFHEGEIVSIVGESGSGKTTTARMILGLLPPSSGEVYYKGQLRNLKKGKERKAYWKNIQGVFQDPFSSFNQFFRVETVLRDCIKKGVDADLTEEQQLERMRNACTFVNLKYDELYNKYPFELSGGQMQRLMIARIFVWEPHILIADEPTSMVDACSRSTILDMLMKLRDTEKMTIIFITHDLGLAYYVSDTIYIMEKGRFVESGPADEVILNPQHAYTKQLLNDVPKLNESWSLN